MNIKRYALSLIVALFLACVSVIGLAGDAQAAMMFHSGFETGDLGEWSSVLGSASINETTPKTGNYSLRCNPTASSGYISWTPSSNIQRFTAYIYIAQAPDSDIELLGQASYTYLKLTTTFELDLYNKTGGKLADGTTQLDTSTWYRVSGTIDSANKRAYVWINGNIEHDGVSVTSTEDRWGDSSGAFRVGVKSLSATSDLYFDDVICDDTTSSTADLGDIRVLRAQPDADGTNTDWGTRVPSDGRPYFSLVGEVPADDANYVAEETNSDLEETYDLQECTTIGLGGSDTINAVSTWCRMRRGNGAGSTHQIVEYDGGNYETTVDVGASWAWNNLYRVTKPSGGSWTQTAFDGYEAGAGHAGDGGRELYLSCVMVMVAYTPAAEGEPDIVVSPDTWTLNDIVGDGYTPKGTSAPDKTYYANPLGDGTPPSSTVQDSECQFTLTNSSTMNITIRVNCSNFSGGSANMTNSNDGSNGVDTFGGYSWYSGMTYSNKKVMKTTASDVLWTSSSPGEDIKFGVEIETQTNMWSGTSSSTATITVVGTAV